MPFWMGWIVTTPQPQRPEPGKVPAIPFFDFTVFLRAADTFYVRREKRRQMQSQYEIRAFIIEGCSGLFFAIGAFEPYRLADLRQIPIQHHPLAPYLVNLTLDRLQFHNSTILFLESLFSIQRANNFFGRSGPQVLSEQHRQPCRPGVQFACYAQMFRALPFVKSRLLRLLQAYLVLIRG